MNCDMCGVQLHTTVNDGTCSTCTVGIQYMGPVSLRTQQGRDAAAMWLLLRPGLPVAPLAEGLADAASVLDIHAYADMDPDTVPPVPAGTDPFVPWRWIDADQLHLAGVAMRDVVKQSQEAQAAASREAVAKQSAAVRAQIASWGAN